MNHIITFAIIVFVILCAVVLAKGTSFTLLFNDVGSFIKSLFRKKTTNRIEKGDNRSLGTTGLSSKKQKNEGAISHIGKQATAGIQAQITVFDSAGKLIGTKNACIDDVPLLIGRGTDKTSYIQKLCLPDITDDPTTSRTHCILVSDSGNILLKDCYNREVAFDVDGHQIHSVTYDYKTDEYVGDGFLIKSGEKREVTIGDYLLEIKNLSPPLAQNIPTYGHKKEAYTPTKIARADTPTKKYIPKQ